jgi:hypothetical protein
MLVGCDHFLLLRDFGPHVIMFMNVCLVIIVATVWQPFPTKGFWALWDNIITVATVMLLWEAYYVHVPQHSIVIITSIYDVASSSFHIRISSNCLLGITERGNLKDHKFAVVTYGITSIPNFIIFSP